MLKRIVFLGVLFLTLIVSPARADFFDSSDWWMSPSQWVDNSAFDPADHISVNDVNDRLEFSADFSLNQSEGWEMMVSKWNLSLDEDFDLAVSYYHDVNTAENGMLYSDLEFNLVDGRMDPLTTAEPQYIFALGARSRVNGISSLAGLSTIETPGNEENNFWARAVEGGIITAKYDSVSDVLEMKMFENGSSEGMGITVPGLKSVYELDSLKVVLGAGSEDVPFGGEHAYFKDLKIDSAKITPEPVSSLLFLLGGAAMAVRAGKRA